MRAVQGLVHVSGSVTVTSYTSVPASARENRSTRRSPACEPLKFVLPEKLVVSTTSASPSQRPRGSPCHWRMPSATCGRPSSGITRVSWIISMWTTTWSGVCSISVLLL